MSTRQRRILDRINELVAVGGISPEDADEYREAAREYTSADDLAELADEIGCYERAYVDAQFELA